MEFLAPAKTNLSLRVLGRRDDGFHEIESLIVPISVFDKLDFELRDSGGLEFVCSDASLPTDDTNLVVRAVRLFCTTFGFEPHVRVELRKVIPHGAGLGGGSSDAATTLLALDRLFQTEIPRERLVELAAELGSDVPFFVMQSAAVCRGRGEIVTPTAFPHALPLLLVKPAFGVPTPWAYRHWRESIEIPSVHYAAQEFSWGVLVNDLERPVFEKHLFLAHLKTWLLGQPEVAGALLSGSGSTVFAVLREASFASVLGAKIGGHFGTDLWCHFAETIHLGA